MLMESLAAGRGISLPAAASGAAQIAARSCGAYAVVREQFGIPIGKFEGVQEALARIGGRTWLLDAGRDLMTSALAAGEKPAVLSAIVKAQCTELSRGVVNDAMDIHGGKAICLGARNYLARTYQQIPIGITVEGANILTRALIIFGQGAMRCHPFLLDEINAAQLQDEDEALEKFDAALCKHVQHLFANKMRAVGYSFSRGKLARGVGDGLVKRHSRSVEHLCAAFAFLADITLFQLGGDLKRREMLSGRFADALGNLYLASAAIKRFRDGGESETEAAIADWACRYALYHAQESLDGILRNYPQMWLGRLLRITIFGGGRYCRYPDDKLSREVAELLQTDGAVRDKLTADVYVGDATQSIASLEAAFKLMTESKSLRRKLKRNGHEITAGQSYDDWLAELREADVLSLDDATLLTRTRDAVGEAISVDEFAAKPKRVQRKKKSMTKKKV